MKPFVIYMIGMSGSGKTTIAEILSQKLQNEKAIKVQYIDGDIIRKELGDIFGFSFEERMKNNRAVCVAVSYLIRNGINVVLSQVGAYQVMREQVKELSLGEYIEIYIKCSEEELARRDVKNYYRQAREGTLHCLNGVNTVFEEPLHSNIVIDTELLSVEESVDQIVGFLQDKHYIS